MPGLEPDSPVKCVCYPPAVPFHSLSYQRLPQQYLNLSVHRLNGSCFEVEVAMTATVGELKEAVENVFSHSQQDGHLDISWSHVWGHFCLGYKSYKLLDDKERIRSFRIRDGDQASKKFRFKQFMLATQIRIAEVQVQSPYYKQFMLTHELGPQKFRFEQCCPECSEFKSCRLARLDFFVHDFCILTLSMLVLGKVLG